MKTLAILVASALAASVCSAQTSTVSITKICVSGLPFTTNKAQVSKLLGKPLSVVEPHYECGEYSSQQMGQKFYLLSYRQAAFIGNSQQGYELESFVFAPTGPAQLTYGRWKFSATTTLPELTQLFGKLESYKKKDGSVEVVVREQDASAIFTFKAGHLARYDYHGVGC